MTDILWHYTTFKSIESILIDKNIMPATDFVDAKREKPAVWFSSNQYYEETARRGIKEDNQVRRATFEEMTQAEGGLARVGVKPEMAPHTWEDFKRTSGIPRRVATALEEVAAQEGANPEEWRASFEPVPKEQWVAVELWDPESDCWVDVLEQAKKTRAERDAAKKE